MRPLSMIATIMLLSCATTPKGELARLIENREATYRVKTLPKGHGSGVVVSREGHILTASHVVAGNPILEITVRGDDGKPKTYIAEVVDIDPDHDLALIKIPRTFANVAVLEDPKNVSEGDEVYNIGYPFMLERVVGRGSIMKVGFSATVSAGPDEPKFELEDALILDIPDGPGTSGSGVFLAKNGKLVGVMCMILPLFSQGHPPLVLKIAQSVEHARVLLDRNDVPYRSGATIKEPDFRLASTADEPEWIVTVKSRGNVPAGEAP